MNITLIIIVVEVLIVLSAVVGALFYSRWKIQKVKTVEFDGLLTTFENQIEERKAQLILMLKESYEMEAKGAEESACYMVEAEKQFLQEFLKQQIEQTPVNDFYLHLSELLDQYLYFVPKLNDESNNIEQAQVDEVEEDGGIEKEESVEELEENNGSETNTSDQDIEDPEKTTDSDETEININVDDSVEDTEENLKSEQQPVSKDSDSKQDRSVDSSKPETVTDENNSEPEEAEGEPDWGDAFAESGDEVDEATETAFEAEKDKE